jgi:hypothetical protein
MPELLKGSASGRAPSPNDLVSGLSRRARSWLARSAQRARPGSLALHPQAAARYRRAADSVPNKIITGHDAHTHTWTSIRRTGTIHFSAEPVFFAGGSVHKAWHGGLR